MDTRESELLKQIIQHYSVGEIIHYEVLPLGYVNTSYAVTTSTDNGVHKYLLRLYRAGVEEAGVIFEHSIIKHLERKGFDLTARVLPTNSGSTYICRRVDPYDDYAVRFYALSEYLSGEDKFSWIKPECSDGEIAEAGKVLARFHDGVSDLIPSGQRSEPAIIDLLPLIAEAIKARLVKNSGSSFYKELLAYQDFILCAIQNVHRAIDGTEFRQTLHLINHGDYHPGNLKFDGGKVVGLFDLDWSKVDARTFDLGVALTYFCASWDMSRIENYFRLDRAVTFLSAYQTELTQIGGVSLLDAIELKFLPEMVAAGNIYIMEWALRDYYERADDPPEYLSYLQHHLCLMHWFEDQSNRRQLDQMIQETLAPLGIVHTERRDSGS